MDNDDSAKLPEPLNVTFPVARHITGDSIPTLYRAAARGELEVVKVGRSSRITMASIRRRQANLPRAKFRGSP